MPYINLQVVTRYYTPYACSDNRPLSYHLSLWFGIHIADYVSVEALLLISNWH